MSNTFKGQVIEVYPSEGKAAVRFSWRGRERVECVRLAVGPEAAALEVGERGWITYTTTTSCGLWGFTPFKQG